MTRLLVRAFDIARARAVRDDRGIEIPEYMLWGFGVLTIGLALLGTFTSALNSAMNAINNLLPG
jgi:hypothetical protein